MTNAGEEQVNVLESITAITSAYREGSAAIQKLKAQCASEQAAQPPRILEEVIDEALGEIEKEKSKGISRFGKAFEKGDGTAVISLQQITIQLQSSLLEKLKDVALDDDDAALSSLADAADLCRHRTSGALLELRQRLMSVSTSQQNTNGSTAHVNSRASGDQQEQQKLNAETKGDTFVLKSSQEKDAIEESWELMSKETSPSPDTIGEEDSASTANRSRLIDRRSKTSSGFLGFLRNVRERSNSHKDAIDEEGEVRLQPLSPSFSSDPSEDGEAQMNSRGQDADLPQFTYEEGDISWSRHRQSQDLGRRDSRAPPKLSLDAVDTPQGNSRNNSTTTLSNASTSSSRTVTMTYSPTNTKPSRTSISNRNPTPENDYLGFCKGAWKLQTGDRKAMPKVKEFNDGWSQSSVYCLTCVVGKCAFAGHIAIERIWTKVWPVEPLGLAFRWQFLAKSHILQTKVKDRKYQFQCLFCTFLRDDPPVLSGTDAYLEHVSKEHRGRPINDIVLYKTGCIADHVCQASEEFDINIFPLTVAEQADMDLKMREEQMALGTRSGSLGNGDAKPQDSVVSEPWNSGLSEFHYDDEMAATEKEC